MLRLFSSVCVYSIQTLSAVAHRTQNSFLHDVMQSSWSSFSGLVNNTVYTPFDVVPETNEAAVPAIYLWEPGWTTEVAALSVFATTPHCWARCKVLSTDSQKPCCALCGMYSIGAWKATSNTENVVNAIGDYAFRDTGYVRWLTFQSKYMWDHQQGHDGGACELEVFSPLTIVKAVCGQNCKFRCRVYSANSRVCNATLLGLGDSTIRQQLAYLAHRVGAVGVLSQSRHRGSATLTVIEGNTTIHLKLWVVQVLSFRNLPGTLSRAREAAHVKKRGLVEIVRHSDAIVVNVGPGDMDNFLTKVSWKSGAELLEKVTPVYWKKAQELVDGLASMQFHGRLVFRTTPRGIPFCWEKSFRTIFSSPIEASGPWAKVVDLGHKILEGNASTFERQYFRNLNAYGWEYFPIAQRAFAHALAAACSAKDFKFVVLDVGGLGELSGYGKPEREPDETTAGGDCLHDWQPSVVDWYNAHLLQVLRDVQ
jgi:hypothetical protein